MRKQQYLQVLEEALEVGTNSSSFRSMERNQRESGRWSAQTVLLFFGSTAHLAISVLTSAESRAGRSLSIPLSTMSDDYTPWGEREEFKDIVPILQDDGPEETAVIRIPYTKECTFRPGMVLLRDLVCADTGLKTGDSDRRSARLQSGLFRLVHRYFTLFGRSTTHSLANLGLVPAL